MVFLQHQSFFYFFLKLLFKDVWVETQGAKNILFYTVQRINAVTFFFCDKEQYLVNLVFVVAVNKDINTKCSVESPGTKPKI